MKRLAVWVSGSLLALTAVATTQAPPSAVAITSEPHHHLVFASRKVRIFDVLVPPHGSTLWHRHDYDYFFVVLNQSRVRVERPGQPPQELNLPAGAVRVAGGGFVHALENEADTPFHNVTVELLDPHTLDGRCGCTATEGLAAALCGCAGASLPAPPWTARLGQLELASVVLDPGGHYEFNRNAGTRFLIALTRLAIRDIQLTSERQSRIRLSEGHFHWLSPGPHRIENESSTPTRFLSVAF